MMKSLQNCSITNTRTEVLLSARFISVSSAEPDMDVMHKKPYGSYCSAFPWDSQIVNDPDFLLLEHRCGTNCYVKCFDDTERKGACGRNNAQASIEVGLSCQAASQRQCRTVLHPTSGSSSKWEVFLRCFPLSHGDGAQLQLALQAHPASVISRMSVMFPESFSSSNTRCHI